VIILGDAVDDEKIDGEVRGDLGEREEILFKADCDLVDFGGDSMALLLLSMDDIVD
jgi:hypothetical protein